MELGFEQTTLCSLMLPNLRHEYPKGKEEWQYTKQHIIKQISMDSFTDVCSSALASDSVQIAVLSSQATCNKIMFFWLEKGVFRSEKLVVE